VDWQTFFLALGTIITGASGCVVAVHEFRKHDRKALNEEAKEMSDDLAHVRHDLVVCRRYAFDLADRLASLGHAAPDPPEIGKR